jgi:hypothetical protein
LGVLPRTNTISRNQVEGESTATLSAEQCMGLGEGGPNGENVFWTGAGATARDSGLKAVRMT